MKNIGKYLSQGKSVESSDCKDKVLYKRTPLQSVSNPRVLAHLSQSRAQASRQSKDAAEAVSQVLRQIAQGKGTKQRSATLGMFDDPLRKIPRYQREIIKASLLAKGGSQSIKNSHDQFLSKLDTKSKKSQRSIIIRRLKSSQLSSTNFTRVAQDKLQDSPSFSKNKKRTDPTNCPRPPLHLNEMELRASQAKRALSPKGKEGQGSGLLGTPAQELIAGNLYEQTEEGPESASPQNCHSSSSSDEDPLEAAFAGIAARGGQRAQQDYIREPGAGARKIKELLAMDEEEEEEALAGNNLGKEREYKTTTFLYQRNNFTKQKQECQTRSILPSVGTAARGTRRPTESQLEESNQAGQDPEKLMKKNTFASTTSGGAFMGLKKERSLLKNQKPLLLQANMSKRLIDESRVTTQTESKNIIPGLESKADEIKQQIPRTGIEQPFLISPPVHIQETNDLERVNEMCSQTRCNLIEDYRLRDTTRVINLAKTVYDAEKESPHYKNQTDYIDNEQQIRITKGTVNGRPVENPKASLKNRYFKELKPWYVPYQYQSSTKHPPSSPADKDDVLIFESRFESGNLKEAIQLDRREYELVLKPDYGTKNYTQWFYFKISNTRKHSEYIFHIINFMKPDSLFNGGMKPLFYSKKRALLEQNGWFRSGYDIAYYQNNQPYCKIYGESQQEAKQSAQNKSGFVASNQKEPTNFYTLSFKFSLTDDNDEVYIAMCYPYTYTDCMKFMDKIIAKPDSSSLIRRTTICKTIAGNFLDMLIITNFKSSQDMIAKRKCLIITGRVHPGESNASFIVEGLIQYLLSNDNDAILLRDRYVFKIVPMLNPDGVIVGNYRCSLSGHDMNRQYLNPSPKSFPEVFAVKTMIRKTLECRNIELYCDFHGHSRQKDLFMYGCTLINQYIPNNDKNLKERVFPYMFDQLSGNFSYKGSSFNVNKSKESTGRVVMWKEFQLLNSYTCEASFCGPSQGYYSGFHFNIKMLLDMGKDFCKTLRTYSDPDPQYYQQMLGEIQYELQQQDAIIAEETPSNNKTRLGKIKKHKVKDPLKGILSAAKIRK